MAPPPPPPPPVFVDWKPPEPKAPSKVHGWANRFAGKVLGDRHLRRMGQDEMDAHDYREDVAHWRHGQREYAAEGIERMGWWNPRSWGQRKTAAPHTAHNVGTRSRTNSSVGHGTSVRRTTAHRDATTGDTVIETRNGTRIEIPGGQKSRKGSSHHRTSGSHRRSRRDGEHHDRRLSQYRSVHPDYANRWRRPWGHMEHRCHPGHHGIFKVMFGTLFCRSQMRHKGREQRELAKRERRKERRRRWALFKAEIRAHRDGHRTPYTL
ncbi:hypothetical protein BKA62DRAFT_828861 [Auriculariales sp. MPI-PUGE-AT-0066]|nr:hypothetical protein BKA62DRAFT_828861 [Auriculariales sp. MPI-PUGE-AT-0066]